MRFITYNVNSLNARLPRVMALLDEYQPDVVCLQETKASPEKFPHLELQAAGYDAVDNSGGRWAGVAVLARSGLTVADIEIGMPGQPSPNEARWVAATVGGVRVVSTYVPNGRALGTETFAEKLVFLDAMAVATARFAGEPAFVAGDMNVCLTDLDVWDPAKIHGATHITPEERTRLQAVIDAGYVDAFRHLEADDPGFTWWDYRAGHFHKGFGLRIDLALMSGPLADRLEAAYVDRDYRKPTKVRESKPSDHAPLIIDLAD